MLWCCECFLYHGVVFKCLMGKTSYIVIIEPKIDEIEGSNPEQAEALYRNAHKGIKDLAIVPRSALKLNGKRIPYKK